MNTEREFLNGVLAKLEKLIKLDNHWQQSTDPELMDNYMDSLQRWEIEACIDSIRDRLEKNDKD